MQSLNQGDVVFAYFPYEEDKSINKPRPCLILAVDTEHKKFLAAKITTTKIERSWAIFMRSGTKDMRTGSMRSDSWINLTRREWIPFSDFIFI